METLTNLTLQSMGMDRLHGLAKVRYLPVIESEIGSRLLSSDRNTYIPTLNYLYNQRFDPVIQGWLKSSAVKQGLEGSLPWKIGVIYDYRDQSYRIKHIQAIIGLPTAYKLQRGYFKPNWLDSDRTKLALREVINRTGKPVNNVVSVVTTDPTLDNKISESLLYNDVVQITTCTFLSPPGSSFQSYPRNGYMANREAKQIYPCSIKVGNFEHNLINAGNIADQYPQTFNVTVTKTPEVEKLLTLIGLIK